ncbi:MAG TPA: SDR family NAD(P)-dependent oxidoreductase [Steroidobacteraceae bacterium]|jgi:NAD(P)-dependent dehydrogenase (short-subunit alcohol dehydrogenase family)|nr:SDR family NAD(P)-dependent oxidoreductase [Steroidobacteraceae bacterium]
MILETPSFRLDNQRAVITGAGRGIGFACACALAGCGAAVTLLARSYEEVEASAQAIRASGGAAEAICLDVTDLSVVQQFFDRQPAYDILVNNAGTNRPMEMINVTENDYDIVLGLNLKSAFFVAQAVAKKMIAAQRAGCLIHMSSQMGHVGASSRSLYCASKWGLEGMNKALALELAPHGIRSNTIAPTYIETPLTASFFTDARFLATTLSKIKLGRLGRPQDIMGAVLFLASDAAALVTGTSIVIDGGWTAD